MESTSDAPPPFDPPHLVELSSLDASKIINVSLYAGRAEITRLYKFAVRIGQNHVVVNGLPSVLDHQSLRVEGRGAATIHDVALSSMPSPPVVKTSAIIEELLLKKQRSEKALERCKKSLSSLEGFLSTLNVQHIDVTALGKVMENYDATGSALDDKVIELEKTLKGIDEQLEIERKNLNGPSPNAKLGHRATIGVFAQLESEVEMSLIYAVHHAEWSAGYDVRVDMQTKDKPVTLIYKGAIKQSTGEAWDDVPLTLETATPTFGIDIPALSPWNLSVLKPVVIHAKSRSLGMALRSRTIAESEESDDVMGFGLFDNGDTVVSSKGNISATFRVPGLISIPSDGDSHNVTITQLKLDASMSWVSVPKVDAKSHLKAKIVNESDYTFLRGIASVYVDGSFISRSNVPLVSPKESFDCPLGLDPSIRVTYHPRVKKVSQTGFYTKTSNHTFSQRITIFNTKSSAINDFKVIDQIPVSEDDKIDVKLVDPSLVLPNPTTTPRNNNDGEARALPPVKVSNGVIAQWEGADEPGFDVESLGKDGKFNWVCSIPAQGKVNLLLAWEVSVPTRANVVGLS